MRRLFLLILFLFLVTSVYAEYSEEIYDGWSYSGDNFTVDSYTFKIGVNQPQYKVSVNVEGLGSIILYNDSCSELGNYSICLRNITFGYHNSTIDKDFYKTRLEIDQYLAYVGITRTVSKTSLLIGETSYITLLISNAGSIPAKDIVYEEDFDGFVINEVSGCSFIGSKITWRGSLVQGITQKCSFTLTATKATTLQATGKITYYNGRAIKQISSQATTITVADYPLKINVTISKNRIDINDNVTLNVTLKNTHASYPMLMYGFAISVPYGLKILQKSPDLNLLNNKFSWQGNLEPGEFLNFFLLLKGELQDNYIIQEEAEYLVNNQRYEYKSETPLEVYITEPEVVFQKEDELSPREKTHIKIYARNPSSEYIFKDLEILFSTDLPGIQNIKKTVSELKKNSYETILETDFIAPEVNNETTFYLKVKINYKSIYAQYLRLENESYITIKPKSHEVIAPQNESVQELIPSEARENVTQSTDVKNETIEEQLQQKAEQEKPLMLSTKEELVDRVRLSKKSLVSGSFIVLDIVTIGLLILAFIKLR